MILILRRIQSMSSGVEFISLDLETTGFSPSTCDIIEIGAWHFKDGIVVDKFSSLVRPVRYIPTQVQNLTGITNEMLSDAETIDSVLPQFFDFCGDNWFLGYNLDFDYRFLVFKGKALGIDFSMNHRRMGVDVLKLVREKGNFKSNKLEYVAQKLGIPTEDKCHRAYFDSYITKLVYDRYCTGVKPTYIENVNYGSPVIDDTLSFT